jgi:orotate phosphoribosyltransferase
MDQRRKRLADLIKERSFRRGNFTLASGKQSAYYFDSKPTMLHPEGAALLAALIVDEIRIRPTASAFGDGRHSAHRAGGDASGGRRAPAFVRKAPKDHGTRKRIEGLDMAGRTAVILEDVTTTGGSAMQAVEEVRAAGGTVALVLSILDRGEGAAELYAAAGVPFKSLFRAEEFLRD